MTTWPTLRTGVWMWSIVAVSCVPEDAAVQRSSAHPASSTPITAADSGGAVSAAPTSSSVLPPPTSVPPSASTPAPAPAKSSAPFPTNELPAQPTAASTASATPAPGAATGQPIIPMVKGECPKFANGTISFMGLGGITVAAGAKAAGATAPFVFYWHGTGSFSGEYTGMAAAIASGVAAEGGVLVSFQGSTGGDALSGTSVFGKGDLDIGDQLVACAVRDHNVDPRRIYATGCSAGGLFSTNQAALRSSYIAAAAPNSGGMTFPQAFQGMNTPALMTVHGASGQDVVIIDFSQSSATADKLFKMRGGFVINCNHGGGHCGGGAFSGDVWKFFAAHSYGVSPSPWKDALPAGFNAKCAIYTGM